MQPWVWVTATAASTTAVVCAMWWSFNRTTEAKLAEVEAAAAKAVTEAEAKAEKAEAKAAKAEAAAERHVLAELRDRLPATTNHPTRGQTLQQEVEFGLGQLMRGLGATESSVLVSDPDPSSEYLFFLALHGGAAAGMRKIMVGRDTLAGKVLRSRTPIRVTNPYENPDFSSQVDTRIGHTTREMLTIPLVVDRVAVGVAQFLNRTDGRSFSAEDESRAMSESGRIALKVAEFVRDTENYVQLGLYSPPSPSAAVIMFCDLSASSSLFDVLHASGAIVCLNDYLSQTVDIILTAGGSVDQYLGDGAMCRFIPEADADPAVVARRAAQAAVDSMLSFQTIKDSWLASHWEVGAVFSRMGIAYGDFREPVIGPTRKREPVILGSGVHRAAELCDTASRRKNVILVDRPMATLLGDGWRLERGPSEDCFEVLGRA